MKLTNVIDTKTMLFFASILSVFVINYSFHAGYLVTYGDAESHLNIAKRVVHSITPGFSQLGGIWLPLPHLLMIPFVYFDSLWRTGLAGSILSGISFVISAVFIYKLVLLVTDNKYAALISFLIFSLNPNILYMQTTAMSELPLIVMDTALFYSKRMGLDNHEALNLCKSLIADMRIYGGAFTINWHTRSLGPERNWDDFYLELIRMLKKENVWFAKAKKAVTWFRKRRSEMLHSVLERLADEGVVKLYSKRGCPGLLCRLRGAGKALKEPEKD